MEEGGLLSLYLEEMGQIPEITPEELNLLRWDLAREDPGARQRAVEGHLKFVLDLTRGYMGRGLGLGDLMGESHVALTLAVHAYRKGDLREQIRRQVIAALEEATGQEKAAKEGEDLLARRLNALMETAQEMALELGREATPGELALRLLVPVEEVEEMLKIGLNAME